ncbi:MAP3K epsilon protein kinase 1 [Diplonema papillatum]|nr:MAP3K epsilon protein kinase 1 [Diplonema papillatum]
MAFLARLAWVACVVGVARALYTLESGTCPRLAARKDCPTAEEANSTDLPPGCVQTDGTFKFNNAASSATCKPTSSCLCANSGLSTKALIEICVGGSFLLVAAVVLALLCRRKAAVRGVAPGRSWYPLSSLSASAAHNRGKAGSTRRSQEMSQIRGQPLLDTPAGTARAVPAAAPTPKSVIRAINGRDSWTEGKIIGQGSYGRVVRGVMSNGQMVAVKVLNVQDNDETKANKVLAEVETMCRLKHPHIVTYKWCTYDSVNKQLYIGMEYMQSGSLGALVRELRTPLPETVVAIYLNQVVAGVGYLHAKNIMHRDLKGDNLLVDASGVVKLSDFGTCKTECIGQSVTMVGTPLWMSPEAIRTEVYTTKSDIWSLGVVACELLNNGKPPWPAFDSVFRAFQFIGSWREPLPPGAPRVSPDATDFLKLCFTPDYTERADIATLQQHRWLKTRPSKEDMKLCETISATQVHMENIAAVRALFNVQGLGAGDQGGDSSRAASDPLPNGLSPLSAGSERAGDAAAQSSFERGSAGPEAGDSLPSDSLPPSVPATTLGRDEGPDAAGSYDARTVCTGESSKHPLSPQPVLRSTPLDHNSIAVDDRCVLFRRIQISTKR